VGELDLFLRRYGAALDEVPDPYYGGADGFEQVLDLIERLARRWCWKSRGGYDGAVAGAGIAQALQHLRHRREGALFQPGAGR
jgi:protein-tyrosine phosphatase